MVGLVALLVSVTLFPNVRAAAGVYVGVAWILVCWFLLARTRTLWTRQISDQEFELCCIPFFLFDVALGDVVRTDGSLVLHAVVRPAGRWVFRAIFPKPVRPNEDILDGLASRGAIIEWSSATMIAIDAADAVMAQQVADYLAELEGGHRLVYETGKS